MSKNTSKPAGNSPIENSTSDTGLIFNKPIDKAVPMSGSKYVVQKGTAKCSFGNPKSTPHFLVTNNQKLYLNDESGDPDYLAVTERDTVFQTVLSPFGYCTAQPNSPPCNFAAAGIWSMAYKNTKVGGESGVSLLTEQSFLTCSSGMGTITVDRHGQSVVAGLADFHNAKPQVHNYINPLVPLDKFVEELDDNFYS
jgi:hypothetical protein